MFVPSHNFCHLGHWYSYFFSQLETDCHGSPGVYHWMTVVINTLMMTIMTTALMKIRIDITVLMMFIITILIMIIILMMIVIHSNRPTGHILTDRCQLLPLAINRPIRVCGWAVRVKSKREGRIIQLSETQSTFRWIAKPALHKFTGESCPSCPSCNCLAKFDLFE